MWQRVLAGTALRRIALAGAIAAPLVVGLVSPRSAEACSWTGPTSVLDPSISSVVVGQIVSVTPGPSAEDAATPLTLAIDVERYLMGDGPDMVSIVDDLSARGEAANLVWDGLCRSFSADPTGLYVVLAVPVIPAEFGEPFLYGRAVDRNHPDIQFGIDRVLTELAQVTPAPVGNAGLLEERERGDATPLAVLALALVVAAGVAVRHAGRRR